MYKAHAIDGGVVEGFAWGGAKDAPVVRAGQEAHAKDVSYVLSLEHHGPALCLWKAPQAHLCRYHHNVEGSKEPYSCPTSRSQVRLRTSTWPGHTFRSSEPEARKVPS